jgi:hypothetical protein
MKDKAEGFGMTAQIPDAVVYRQESFSLIGLKGTGLITPEQFGIRPAMLHTGCYRGFYNLYELIDDQLYLTRMTVRSADGTYPDIEGTKPVPVEIGSAQSYAGLRIAVPFTGKMRLGKDFMQEFYVHMGFQKPSAFKTVLDLTLDWGRLLKAEDLSTYFAEMRGAFKERYERTVFTHGIEDAFSLDMDIE